MDLKDIEPVGEIYEHMEPGWTTFQVDISSEDGMYEGQKLYTGEQMQEYAKNMVYEALYKHTAFGTGKEELVKHMTNIFFQEKAFKESQDEEV